MAAVSAIRPLIGLDRISLDIQDQIVRYLDGPDRFEYKCVGRRYKVMINKLNTEEYQQILKYVQSREIA